MILAEHDKVEMEDSIRDKVQDMRNTRVVCRSGSPIDLRDLQIVNTHAARSVIVLSPAGDDPDPSVIKTMLALTRGPNRRPTPYHIVAEIQDSENLEAARLVGGDEAVLIDKGETVARLIVQTSRQSGAAVVYTELLDFEGDEVYFRGDVALEGRTYGDVLLAYEDCAIIGLRSPDGTVKLNAGPDTLITPGTQVVAVAGDDERLLAATPCQVEPDLSVILKGSLTPRGAPARAGPRVQRAHRRGPARTCRVRGAGLHGARRLRACDRSRPAARAGRQAGRAPGAGPQGCRDRAPVAGVAGRRAF